MLEVKEVTKKYGGLIALDSVSVDFKKEGVTGIIGPNGSGKTTLLNVISGLVKPDKGRLYLNGADITDKPVHLRVRLGIARTFQFPKYFSKFTVLENLTINADEDKAMEALKLVDLAHKANTPARNLTMYEIRKLEIARALALSPRYILLDEPLSGLSYEESISLSNLLKELSAMGFSLIVVEHKLSILFKYAEKIIVMASGRVVANGTPEEIASNRDLVKQLGL
ncbi:ABC-type branched-chain amino acid transport systems, ATPase component [Pyrobaculum oguniense TE7]|uniref:ABC-type branched-chain amino acid transport systems, ATPase component n=1 Tax=Pyrobaculum oguniense (strain DSM 13380 / JCM 10595 / TE7) TaxID=698757 RepID=H6Q912_PYROT|nr:ABC-type branched-chain amino acid transport systems, ATPase component [Pyrobaculum oguniense TE7]